MVKLYIFNLYCVKDLSEYLVRGVELYTPLT